MFQESGLKKEFEVLQSASNLTELMAVNDIIEKEEKTEVATNANIAKEKENPCNFPENEPDVDIAHEIDYTRYSSWYKLIDVSVQILIIRFKLLIQHKLYSEAKKKVKNMWF